MSGETVFLFNSITGGHNLKTKTIKHSFTEYNFDQYMSQHVRLNATDRLRQIDCFHLHSPLETECERLNIPNSRINLLSFKDVLYICGGLVGARFTNDDFAQIKVLVESMNVLWNSIEANYKEMNPYHKKVIGTEDEVPNDVLIFQNLADEYVAKVAELQAIVKRIQNSIDTSSGVITFDADQESKMGKKMPDWLSALISLFEEQQEKVLAASGSGSAHVSSQKVPLTVGKLSVFLGSVVQNPSQFTLAGEKTDAVSILVQASNDSHANLSGDQAAHLSALPRLDHKYWARRFFNFLSKMTELRSVPKDEKALSAV